MLSESFTVELDKQPDGPDPEPHVAIDIKEDEQAMPLSSEPPPPPFTPYQPEFYYNSHGDLISHDHHLNEDGKYWVSLAGRSQAYSESTQAKPSTDSS